ncbi:MAG: hypothetical protein WAZ48_04320 [Lysobacteraceae bacterium]
MSSGDSEQKPDTRQGLRPAGNAVVPRVRSESIPQEDGASDAANKEAIAIGAGNLEATAKKNDHSRKEQLRDLVHYCSLFVITIVTFLAVLGVVVLSLQYIMPESWGYYRLSEDQLNKLQLVLAAAIGSQALTTYGRKVLDKL